jgi:hypothetical protein
MERGESEGGCLGLFVLLVGLGLLIVAVMWFVSLVGHALALTPTYSEFDRHDGAWIRGHYDAPGLGYVLTVLALVVGVPASCVLTVELWSGRPQAQRVLTLSALLVALVLAIAFAPAGRSH